MSDNIRGPLIIIDDFLSADQCQAAIEYGMQFPSRIAGIGEGEINEEIRKNLIYNMPSNRGVPAMMTGAAFDANWDVFKFDITHVEQSDLLEYGPGGHFERHMDCYLRKNDHSMRKLTSLIILNDQYEGGELTIYHQQGSATLTSADMGSLLIFPSYVEHKVAPVTSGVRYTLVNWLLGPSLV
jgi:PKHD-type hydroxylase